MRAKRIVRTLETGKAVTSLEVQRDGSYLTSADGSEVLARQSQLMWDMEVHMQVFSDVCGRASNDAAKVAVLGFCAPPVPAAARSCWQHTPCVVSGDSIVRDVSPANECGKVGLALLRARDCAGRCALEDSRRGDALQFC